MAQEAVKVWEEQITLPTYQIGKAEKNPIFLEKRVYQGSSGRVYPYPVIEHVDNEATPQTWNAVWIENEYIKVMILPELGGRVQMAYDKIKERHFVYYNHVIKPALVGLTGPWISGGIEFNWPQHHRPSTYLPVDYNIERLDDGGAVIWVNERERMFHQRGMAGFTLRPGKARLEIQGRVSNPSMLPQTFLWWANPAVAVNDYYQSVFPSDVHAVFDHGKRDVSTYPTATGTYYKMDYSAGVDISRYKNIPVPTSYMAQKSGYNFVGGYENDTEAGVLHVANHHISPGKKQWTWGNGDFGQAWDRNLTEIDGPYIELMAGVYTDNQPDFTWLQPGEEKRFVQYFIPYRELGVVKNASENVMMNLELNEQGKAATLKVMATSPIDDLRIVVTQYDKTTQKTVQYIDKTMALSPLNVWSGVLPITELEGVHVVIYDAKGAQLLSWKGQSKDIPKIPDAAVAAQLPHEINTVEQLYLTGLHLEQYRHATFDPMPYYEEGLRRDPNDIRCNNAKGLLLIRQGNFTEAETYLREAVKQQTKFNPNPYDGEPYYNLGYSLKLQGKYDEAFDCFYKSTWNGAWQEAGFLAVSQISCQRQDWHAALDEINKALPRNYHSLRARHLKASILRHLGRKEEAKQWCNESLQLDGFNFGCRYELILIEQDAEKAAKMRNALLHDMRYESHNYEELLLDYADAGLWEEAITLGSWAYNHLEEASPILAYYIAWCALSLNNAELANEWTTKAEEIGETTFFPNHLNAIIALTQLNDTDMQMPYANYLLGNIYYDKKQYNKADECWQETLKHTPNCTSALRNRALVLFNKFNQVELAYTLLEKANKVNSEDARILMELDQLRKRLNHVPSARLEALLVHESVANTRDDLYLEIITLLNQTGEHERALEMIMSRQFHPWEGGEGKVSGQYLKAHLALAIKLYESEEYTKALEHIDCCYYYPHNLGEGKLQNAAENDFDYYKGLILLKLNKAEQAKEHFKRATTGEDTPVAAMYYNDQKPEKIFYQGLAFRQLGDEASARSRFNKLKAYGEKHLYDEFQMDYFAVSLPDLLIWEDDMTEKSRIHCHYLIALGAKGLGDETTAKQHFDIVYALDNNHD